jgi:uncharacterized membrane protein
MTKIFSIKNTNEETDIDKFFKDAAKNAKEHKRTKVLIITLDNDTDNFDHTLSTIGLKSSECVSLLEVTKDTILKAMR